MVGNSKVGDQIRQTNNTFRNMDDFESYINSTDQGYDSEDAFFNGYFQKINTPQFNKVNRSQYGKGCDFKNEIIEYRGNNCFKPKKVYCFVKCINFLTGQEYEKQYLDFIKSEQRRSNILTKARIQTFVEQILLIWDIITKTESFREVLQIEIVHYFYSIITFA